MVLILTLSFTAIAIFLKVFNNIPILKSVIVSTLSLAIAIVFSAVAVYEYNFVVITSKILSNLSVLYSDLLGNNLIDIAFIIKHHFNYLLIVFVSTYVAYFVLLYAVDYSLHIFEHLFYSDNKTQIEFNKHCKCILIDGEWGSGKSYYYRKKIEPSFLQKPLYFSCFSTTKDELITKLIISSQLYNLVSLNGLLIKFMLNNWQLFMPKNKIIVFDDIERMHSESTYEDIIAIISFLSDKNNCNLILIINQKSINLEKYQIFNAYLEKVVDDIITIPKVKFKDIANSLSQIKIDEAYKNEVVEVINQTQEQLKLNNLRILINSYYHSSVALMSFDGLGNLTDLDKEILLRVAKLSLGNLIKLNYLFLKDNALYRKAINSQNDDKTNKDLEEYKLKPEDVHTYGISMRQELNMDKLKNHLFDYAISMFLDQKYRIDKGKILKNNNRKDDIMQSIINRNKGIKAEVENNDYLKELQADRVALFNSVFFNYLDDSILDFDSGDHREIELYLWGCICIKFNKKLAKKISIILSKSRFTTNFKQFEIIKNNYRVWFYNVSDTEAEDNFKSFSALFIDEKYKFITSDGYVDYIITANKSQFLDDIFMLENKIIVELISKTNLYEYLFASATGIIDIYKSPISNSDFTLLTGKIAICLFYLYNLENNRINNIEESKQELIKSIRTIEGSKLQNCIDRISKCLDEISPANTGLIKFTEDFVEQLIK